MPEFTSEFSDNEEFGGGEEPEITGHDVGLPRTDIRDEDFLDEDMDKDKFMTVDELSQYIKVPKPTLYMHLCKGHIPGAKIGRQWRFNRDTIDKWMAEKEKYYSRRKGRRKTDIVKENG